MLVSDNEEYVKKANFTVPKQGNLFLHYEHKELGYNYRLSNLLAALGRAQLKKIDYFVSKRDIFKLYYSELSNLPGFNFMPEGKQNLMNRWLTALTIDKEKRASQIMN